MRAFVIFIIGAFLCGCAHQPSISTKNDTPATVVKVKRIEVPSKVAVSKGAVKHADKKIEKAVRDTRKAVEKAAQDALSAQMAEQRALKQELKSVEKAAQDARKSAEKAAQDARKSAEKAAQDAGKSVEKAAQDGGCYFGECFRYEPKVKGVVPVYFSTNRRIIDKQPFSLQQITYERSPTATLGRVNVSIPAVHALGETERPRTYFFGLMSQPEDADKHFIIQSMSKLTREEFVSALSNPADSLMLFIHGYNVSFQDAAFRAAQIAFDAKYKGRVVMFSWPSKAGMLKYDYDRESALVSTDFLFDLLKMVKHDAKVSKIVVVAHSLGSEVLIGALQQAALSGTKLGITDMVFAASDVSADLYRQRAEQIKAAADKVTLYASSEDWALLASISKSGSRRRMGYVHRDDGPVLVEGVETIDVSAVGAYMFDLNHSTFATSRAVIDDIGRIIVYGDHPARRRTPSLEAMPDEDKVIYWKYPRAKRD